MSPSISSLLHHNIVVLYPHDGVLVGTDVPTKMVHDLLLDVTSEKMQHLRFFSVCL